MTIFQKPENTTDIIYALSPVVYTIYSANNTNADFEYLLEVRVWNGNSASVPASASYTLSKLPNASGSASFDISGLIRSNLERQLPDNITTSTSQIVDAIEESAWVQVLATYRDSTGGTPTQATSQTLLAVRGYTDPYQGFNGSNGDKSTLSQTMTIDYASNLPMSIGVITDDVKYIDITTASFTHRIDLTGKNTALSTEAYVSVLCGTNWYGGNGIGIHQHLWSTDGATIENISCAGAYLTDGGSYTITTKDSSETTIETMTISSQCELKYSQSVIGYLNKFGAYDYIPATLVKTESASFTRQRFQNKNATTGINSATYDVTASTYRTFNTQGRQSITINTGYQEEEIRNRIEQMLMSEEIFMYDATHGTRPLSASDSSVRFQLQESDKLINYQLQFDIANDLRNVVTI